MKKITMLAFDDAASTTITGPMDVFQLTGTIWNRLHGNAPAPYFQVEAVSPTGDPVRCSNGLTIGVNRSMDEVEGSDLIIISAMVEIERNLEKQQRVIPWLQKQYASGCQIAAVCMGTFVLAETGLLDGKIATTHWGVVEKFRKRYPEVVLKPEQLFTDACDLYCSGAFSSSIDLSIYLVEKFFGREVAVQTAKVLVHDIGRISQAPYTPFNFQRNHHDEAILKSQRLMEEEFASHFDIARLAAKQGIGRRTFERRFKAATGDSPLHYLQRVRVEKAKKVLESEWKTLEEISYQVGYEDTSFFKKVFVRHTGLKPTEYRAKFMRVVDFSR